MVVTRRLTLLLLTLLVLSSSASTGCAGRQMVSADVPLQRVMLYRNGVGYFERAGHIEGDTLQFRVRREHIGDFLATLTVLDEQGHARSVSFPSLEPDEDDDGLVNVELRLGGAEEHDLTVAYVVETPIWRPGARARQTVGSRCGASRCAVPTAAAPARRCSCATATQKICRRPTWPART